MKDHHGYSVVELLLVALTVLLLVAIIYASFRDAVMVERRALAQQALMTSAGLQERWFMRLYEYAGRIDDVGGADAAGQHYILRVTQDPCGDTSCYTVVATAIGKQTEDHECEKMSVNNMGIRRATNKSNEDTTKICWEHQT